MSANIERYQIPQPSDPNARLWRYMDFTKYVELISSRMLYFCRSDLFRDPYEGTLTNRNIDSYNNSEFGVEMVEIYKRMPHCTFINCWHMNQFESAAMWDLYAKTNESVAIETTYSKLSGIIDSKTIIGMVNYLDYSSEMIPEHNTYYPFMHKRKSFEHEKEVRLVLQDLGEDWRLYPKQNPNIEAGRKVGIDIDSVISAVHVSPSASQWFFELVKNVTQNYGISIEVNQSSLYNTPNLR